MEQREMTFGEKACGVSFNPGNNLDVDQIKKAYAAIVDNLHSMRSCTASKEAARMYSVAITEAQTSQMWAVKAITWAHQE